MGSHSNSISPLDDPVRGLDVTLGMLCHVTWQQWYAPAFSAYAKDGDPESLLLLAERMLDAIEGDDSVRTEGRHSGSFSAVTPPSHQPEFTEALKTLHQLADRFIRLAQAAEDAGFEGNRMASSPHGSALLEAQENFILMLLEESVLASALLGDPARIPGAANHPPVVTRELRGIPPACRIVVKRSYLQFWLLAVINPGFADSTLPTPSQFLTTLRDIQDQIPILRLLAGEWRQWPGFPPARLYAPEIAADVRSELPPTHDWTLRSPNEVKALARQFEQQLRRFVHLAFLRDADMAVYRDVLHAWDPADPMLLEGYANLAEARPWTPNHEWSWRYLTGEVDDPPREIVVPTANTKMSSPMQRRFARDVLEVLREVFEVLSTAARQGRGLYVLMH